MLQTNQGVPGGRVLARQMPPRSEKHANFRRLAQARTEKVLEELRSLVNLSSPNYEFEDAEVERLSRLSRKPSRRLVVVFAAGSTKRSRFTL